MSESYVTLRAELLYGVISGFLDEFEFTCRCDAAAVAALTRIQAAIDLHQPIEIIYDAKESQA